MLHLDRVVGQVCLPVTFRQNSGTGVSTCHIFLQYFNKCVYMLHLDRVVGQVCIAVTFRYSSGTGVSSCHI